jgi:hypothetical protein
MTQPDNEIDPQALTGYLAGHGWQQNGTWRGAPLWTRGDSNVQLLVPVRIEYPDDMDVLRRSLSNLAATENRTTDAVLRDIAAQTVDGPTSTLQDRPLVAASPPAAQISFGGREAQFILPYAQVSEGAIRRGDHVRFLSIDHPNEPLYEVVAEPGNAEPAAVLAHLYDRDTDQLWQLRDIRSGRTVHSDLQLRGWSRAEEISVSDPAEALRLAGEFGRHAHESGIPPVPELDANYVTAVTLWPQIAGDMKRDWLGSWFEASFHDPGVWEDIDWTTELDGTRYAGMSAEQALTAAAADLEVAIKSALPRHALPPLDSVREFLRTERIAEEAAHIADHLSSIENAFDRTGDRAAYSMDPYADLEKFDNEYDAYTRQLESSATTVQQELDTYLREHRDVLGDNPRWRNHYETLDRDDDARRDAGIDTGHVDTVLAASATPTALETALGPLTPPAAPSQPSPTAVTQARPASELPRTALPHQQQDQPRRGH